MSWLRTPIEVAKRRGAVRKRRDVLLAYRDECLAVNDHHGVQDACSDLREVDAVLEMLTWVLKLDEQRTV